MFKVFETMNIPNSNPCFSGMENYIK